MNITQSVNTITSEELKTNFKICPSCSRLWNNREEFLSDPQTNMVGYQVNFIHTDKGLFMFNHIECGTTMAIRVDHFKDLYDGPVYDKSKTGSDECPGFCLYSNELTSCPVECECAYVREVIQLIKGWKKQD